MQPSRVGDTVADRYALQDRIGGGRMSSVYHALDKAAGDAPVAVKLLDTQHPNRIKREFFKRETTALKQLRHPNIVSLQQSGWSDSEGCFYLILDYVPYSLDSYLKDDSGPPPGSFDPFRAIRELASAVAHAHAHDVIHRDIKPSNILIDENGRPQLADFGISKLLDHLTIGETLAGYWSGGYASPEQRASRPVNPKSDIYSLGAVFYHLLSGLAPPAEGPTPAAVEENCGMVPVRLRNILKEMLASDPEQREYSGSALVAALEAITRQRESLPKYPLILTNRAIDDLRRDGYIQNADFSAASDVIRENLGGASYSEVYLQRDRRNSDHLLIMGDSLRLVCATDTGCLVVIAVHTPHLSDLERGREWAVPYRAMWEPAQGDPASLESSDLKGLLAVLDAQAEANSADQEQRRSRGDFIQHWLDALRYQERRLADSGLEYDQVDAGDGSLIFSLTEPPPDNLDWWEDSPLAVAASSQPSNGQPRTVPVGNLVEIRGQSIEVAKLNRRSRQTEVPARGRLMVDPVQARSANRRQFQAAYNFLNREMVNPKLADVVVDPSAATRMPEPALDFFQDWLSEDKKSAVCSAVSSNEMFLIQGPPGTGKTAVIAEIILQILKQDPEARILLSSQSNVAVDHALSQVGRAARGETPEMVRLGRAEKIGLDSDNWTIEQRADAWRQEVLGKCNAVVGELRQSERDYQVQVDDGTARAEIIAEWLEETRKSVAQLPESEPQVRDLLEALAGLLSVTIDYTGFNAPDVLAEIVQVASSSQGGNGDSLNATAKLESVREILAVLEDWRRVVGRAPDFMKLIVEQSNVVGATCLFSGGRQMPEANFDWAIIDEAGRATVPEALVPMVKAERVILVGDERQLPPMVDDMMDAESSYASEDVPLEKSLFQILVEEMGPEHLTSLRTQYRMHPAIGNLISAVFYDGRIEQGTTTDNHRDYAWTPRPVTWLSTSTAPDRAETRRGQSFANWSEANLILRKLQELEEICRQNQWQPTVGVISGYFAQVEQLRREIDPDNAGRWRQLQLEIATVDSFQGRECDVVIYSTVRSNQTRQIGFLKDYRRINVALSRARDSLVIVGDDFMMRNATIGSDDNPFAAVLEHLRSHPNECSIVAYSER